MIVSNRDKHTSQERNVFMGERKTERPDLLEKSVLKQQVLPDMVILKFIIIIMTVIVPAIIFHAVEADAAYAADDRAIGVSYVDSIGGESTTGVRISKNGKTLNYALDTWKKTSDNEWKYTGSNIDGNIEEVESSITGLPVVIQGKSGARFGINLGRVKSSLPVNGSIVLKKYAYGKCTYKKAEYIYTDGIYSMIDDSESLLKLAEGGNTAVCSLPSTNYGYNGVSYLYDIYDAALISENGDIYTITEDATVLKEGYAYYGIEGEYIIKNLPEVLHNDKEGYTYTLKGWYTSPSGGDRVRQGDAIEPGAVIYPQWEEQINSYNVNCIDILGDNPDGQVLGSTLWTAFYNDSASGADIGSESAAGAYYKGFYYTGCTSLVVEGDCEVYRYFRPAAYDIIFNGNMATSGETVPLYGCIYGSTYTLPGCGFKRNSTVTLDLNSDDAVCTAKNINLLYEFKGWSDTASGSVIYADNESVTNLCESDGGKQLYAIWEGGSTEINAVPEREGYYFSGWSRIKEDTTGNTWFDLSDSNDCVLYAIWKPLKAKYSIEYYIEDDNGKYILDKKSEYDSYNGYIIDCSDSIYIDECYNMYVLNKDKGVYKGTVKLDGSLVLKCYLKKKTEEPGNNTEGDNNSGTVGNPGDGNSGNGSPGSGNPGGGNSGNAGSGSTGGGNPGSAGSGSTGGGNSGSAGSGSTGGGNSGSAGSGSSGGASSGGGSSSAGINVGGSSTAAGNSSGTNNNEDSLDKEDGSVNGAGITDREDNNIDEDGKLGNNKQENNNNKTKGNISASKAYPKTGKVYSRKGIVYKVIKSSNKLKTVKVIKASKKTKVIKIPAFIKINGYKYKVVSIAKGAFIKCKLLKKAVIGKNIKSIGKKAFYKNKKLGNIKIKSKKVKSIGKGAFKHIKPRCAVRIAGTKKYAQKVFAMMNS